MRVGERIVAARYAFLNATNCYAAQSAYDPEFSAAAPGRLLVEQFVRHVFAERVQAIDWGFGEGHWKAPWADGREALGVFALVVSRRGWAALPEEFRPQQGSLSPFAPRKSALSRSERRQWAFGAGDTPFGAGDTPFGAGLPTPPPSAGLPTPPPLRPQVSPRPQHGGHSANSPATSDTAPSPAGFPNHPRLTFDVIRDERGFDALRGDWERLWEQLPATRLFVSFDWCRQGWNCVGKFRGRELHVVVVRDEDEIIAIWPLAITHEKGCRVARWLGSEGSDTRDLLVHPKVDSDWLGSFLMEGLARQTRSISWLPPMCARSRNLRGCLPAAPGSCSSDG